MTSRLAHVLITLPTRRFDARTVARVGLGVFAVVVCGLLAAAATTDVRVLTHYPIPSPHIVEVTGENNVWHVRYPGPDGRLGTADDILGINDLYVPAGIPTRVVLHSRDYIYSLRLPHLKVAEIAVPDLEFELAFHEARRGEYPMESDPMCGRPHSGLAGRLIVETESAYRAALHRFDVAGSPRRATQ